MRYRYTDLLQHPHLHQRLMEQGRFTDSREFIDLPDNFDFQGAEVKPVKVPIAGFGDLVAAIAKPIAKGIDAVAGTDLEHCGGCQQRQDWLNDKIPFN